MNFCTEIDIEKIQQKSCKMTFIVGRGHAELQIMKKKSANGVRVEPMTVCRPGRSVSDRATAPGLFVL